MRFFNYASCNLSKKKAPSAMKIPKKGFVRIDDHYLPSLRNAVPYRGRPRFAPRSSGPLRQVRTPLFRRSARNAPRGNRLLFPEGLPIARFGNIGLRPNFRDRRGTGRKFFRAKGRLRPGGSLGGARRVRPGRPLHPGTQHPFTRLADIGERLAGKPASRASRHRHALPLAPGLSGEPLP